MSTAAKIAVRLCLLVAIFSGVCDSLRAQTWKKIGDMPKEVSCVYFWDTAHGVAGGRGFIYTYNSGVWKEAIYPPGDPFYTFVTAIRFLRNDTLYAATCGETLVPPSGGYYFSTDRGTSWQLMPGRPRPVSLGPAVAYDVYLQPSGNVITGAGYFAQLDSNIIFWVSSQFEGKYSSDKGLSWNKVKPDLFFNVYADTCRKEFGGIGRDDPNGTVNGLWISADSGKSWNTDHTTVPPLSGIIASAKGVTYIQSGPGDVRAIPAFRAWRSIDGGRSWDSIDGPAAHYITGPRYPFAFGDRGQYVIMAGNPRPLSLFFEFPDREVWLYSGPELYTRVRLSRDSGCFVNRFAP